MSKKPALIVSLLMLIYLVVTFAISGCGTREKKADNRESTEADQVEYLFSQDAESGALIKESDEFYTLTLNGVSGLTSVFSLGPEPESYTEDTGEFVSIFDQMFGDEPLSAVLKFEPTDGSVEIDIIDFELSDPEYDKESRALTYKAIELQFDMDARATGARNAATQLPVEIVAQNPQSFLVTSSSSSNSISFGESDLFMFGAGEVNLIDDSPLRDAVYARDMKVSGFSSDLAVSSLRLHAATGYNLSWLEGMIHLLPTDTSGPDPAAVIGPYSAAILEEFTSEAVWTDSNVKKLTLVFTSQAQQPGDKSIHIQLEDCVVYFHDGTCYLRALRGTGKCDDEVIINFDGTQIKRDRIEGESISISAYQ